MCQETLNILYHIYKETLVDFDFALWRIIQNPKIQSPHPYHNHNGSARYFYGLNTYRAILLQERKCLYHSFFLVQHCQLYSDKSCIIMEMLLPAAQKWRKSLKSFIIVEVSRCRYLDRRNIEPLIPLRDWQNTLHKHLLYLLTFELFDIKIETDKPQVLIFLCKEIVTSGSLYVPTRHRTRSITHNICISFMLQAGK
jgi:hypothetical protein